MRREADGIVVDGQREGTGPAGRFATVRYALFVRPLASEIARSEADVRAVIPPSPVAVLDPSGNRQHPTPIEVYSEVRRFIEIR